MIDVFLNQYRCCQHVHPLLGGWNLNLESIPKQWNQGTSSSVLEIVDKVKSYPCESVNNVSVAEVEFMSTCQIIESGYVQKECHYAYLMLSYLRGNGFPARLVKGSSFWIEVWVDEKWWVATLNGIRSLSSIYKLEHSDDVNWRSFIYEEVNSLRYIMLNGYIYDIESQTQLSILRETHDISTVISDNCTSYLPVEDVFNYYVNTSCNLKTCLRNSLSPYVSPKYNTYHVPRLFNDIFKVTVNIFGSKALLSCVCVSIERDNGCLCAVESGAVQIFTPNSITTTEKYSTHQYVLDPQIYSRLNSGCQLLHVHNYKCRIPTFRLNVYAPDKSVFLNFLFQYVESNSFSRWIYRN